MSPSEEEQYRRRVEDELRLLDEEQLRLHEEMLNRSERRVAVHGRHRHGRAHPDLEMPTDEDLGEMLGQLRGRCAACDGKPAKGRFVRYARGTTWETTDIRRPIKGLYKANFLCAEHGELAYDLDRLPDDLNAAERQSDRTKYRRLTPIRT